MTYFHFQVSEIVGPKHRGIYGICAMGAFPVGITLLSLVAYHLPDWRTLATFTSLLGLPLVFLHFYLPESPRWLLTQNRQEEAVKVMMSLAKGNGRTVKEKLKLPEPTAKSSVSQGGDGDNVMNLLYKRRLCLVTLILCYNWFVNGASYYGLTLAAASTGLDVYTGTALSGAVELPAVVMTYFLIQTGGRKMALCATMTCSGMACLTIQMLSGEQVKHLGRT